MELNEELYEKIQQYLDKELEGTALQVFESEIAANPALAREVTLHREMEAFLADTPENDLRKNLQILGQRYTADDNKTGGYWKYLFLFLPFLLIIGTWYAYHTKQPSATETKISYFPIGISSDDTISSNLLHTDTSSNTLSMSPSSKPVNTLDKKTTKPLIKNKSKNTVKSKSNTQKTKKPTITKTTKPKNDTTPSLALDTIQSTDTASLILELSKPVASLPPTAPEINKRLQLADFLQVPIDPKTNEPYQIFNFDTIIYTVADATGYKAPDTLKIEGGFSSYYQLFPKIDSLAKQHNWVIEEQLMSLASNDLYTGLTNLDTLFEKFTKPDFQHAIFNTQIKKSIDHYSLSNPTDSILVELKGDIRYNDSIPLVGWDFEVQIFPSGTIEGYTPIYRESLDLDCFNWYTCRFHFQKNYYLKPDTYYLILTPQFRSDSDIMFAQKFTVSP